MEPFKARIVYRSIKRGTNHNMVETDLPVPSDSKIIGMVPGMIGGFMFRAPELIIQVPDWYTDDSFYVKVSVPETVIWRNTKVRRAPIDVAKYIKDKLCLNEHQASIKIGMNWVSFKCNVHTQPGLIRALQETYENIAILKQELVMDEATQKPRNFDVEDEIPPLVVSPEQEQADCIQKVTALLFEVIRYYENPYWRNWFSNWHSGNDRSHDSAVQAREMSRATSGMNITWRYSAAAQWASQAAMYAVSNNVIDRTSAVDLCCERSHEHLQPENANVDIIVHEAAWHTPGE